MLIVGILLAILAFVAFVIAFIGQIQVLIALFKDKGALHGIFGIFCGIYPYIWGWMNSARLNLKGALLRWTVGLLAFMVFGGAAGGVIGGYLAAQRPNASAVESNDDSSSSSESR